jgi:hypothetical protein
MEIFQSRETNGDALWSIARIIDLAHWKLIKPTIDSGVIWLCATRNRGYRFRSGDARTYCPYFGASGGYAPITVALFQSLVEGSADVRRNLGDGTLRVVERPAETK